MKKIIMMMITIFIILSNSNIAEADVSSVSKRETRAVWISSVHNIDWPNSKHKNNAQAQKQDFIDILDEVKKLGFNTVIVQVRPKGDALYKSEINPWSDVLTGSQGKDPGYDPLEFMIEEAHKRNLELHAWFNPYRITTSGTNLDVLSNDNKAKQNPSWVVESKSGEDKYGNPIYGLFYNPGLPQVRDYIVGSIDEVVKNYDVDGIVFDDYFYPSKDFADQDAYQQYSNGLSLDDFRRDSVNKLVKDVRTSINNIKPYVKFGISPRGIWKNASSDPTGSETSGGQSYYDIYADTRTWINNGWIDYVSPQLYWEIGNKAADYSKLVPWWGNEVQGKNTHLYISQGIYKESVASQIIPQVNLNKSNSNVSGSIHYSLKDIRNNFAGVRDSLSQIYKYPALPKVMNWKDSVPPKSPNIIINRVSNSNEIIINRVSDDTRYYVIYRFKDGESINIDDPSKILTTVPSVGQKSEYKDININSNDKYVYAITSVDRAHNESDPSIVSDQVNNNKHFLDINTFFGEQSAKNAMNALKNETGWYVDYKKITVDNSKYRLVTGEFNSEESVKDAVKKLTDMTGWWVTYETTDTNGKYRIVTGEFNSKSSVESAVKLVKNSMGWWVTYESIGETNVSVSTTPIYRIVTGDFNNESSASNALEELMNLTGWWAKYEPSKDPGKYRIVTGGFTGEESVQIAVDTIRSKFNWWAVHEETGEFVDNYRLVTGDFVNKLVAEEKASWVRHKYGWYVEVKER
ncbi:family 10 glycosylhydrolase [Romboutsia weinsteinii]|nr:family 10 glycosylhydrolase [Romboutsia weinsteinii]